MNKRDQYYAEIWNRVIEYLITNRPINEPIFNTFFKQAHIDEINDQKVVIITPLITQKKMIEEHLNHIQAALQEILNVDVVPPIEIYQQSEIDMLTRSTDQKQQFNSDIYAEFASMPLQKERTFENYVVGDFNRESHEAGLLVAYQPGSNFNPLFIYGNSGLGKTHLLMAIGNYVQAAYPDKKVYYIESLKFVDKVVKAIQSNTIEQFKQYMCSMDILLVDDIQFLAGKEKSHEIFFSIFNELVNTRKQIVIASDRQPKDIKGLEERLISRFSSGLSVGIDSPEFETSLAILKNKIANSNLRGEFNEIEEEGLSYIASNFSCNVRDLEGAVNRVLFYAIIYQPDHGPIRFETVIAALKNQAVVNDVTGLSPNKIIKTVAEYYGLTKQQITGKTRTKNISNARQISIYLCRKLLDLSYLKIGEEFGGRDHSTIISACTKVSKFSKKDKDLASALDQLEKLLTH